MQNIKLTDEQMIALNSVIEEITVELVKAMTKHPSFTTCHHGYAVIKEEVDELWDEVKNRAHNGVEPESWSLGTALMNMALMKALAADIVRCPHYTAVDIYDELAEILSPITPQQEDAIDTMK